MDVLKQWAFSACLAAIVCELFTLFSPSEKLEKTLKITLTLFFLICFLSPIIQLFQGMTSLELKIPDQNQNYQVKTEDYEEKIIRMVEDNLKAKIKTILNENNINEEKISVIINNSQTGSININKIEAIEIVLSDSDKKKASQAEKLIIEQFGIIPTIK